MSMVHVEAVGDSDEEREPPDADDDGDAGCELHPLLERVDDDKEPIHGYRGESKGRDIDGSALGVGYEVTEDTAKDPLACNREQMERGYEQP